MEDLAKKMYDTYSDKVGGLAFNGDVLPHSSEFFNDPNKSKQADAWRAAAQCTQSAEFLVKAKVTCDEVTHNQFQTIPHMRPVYSSNGENASYNTATPSGDLKLVVSKDSEAGKSNFFEPGAEYYVTFQKIPKQS